MKARQRIYVIVPLIILATVPACQQTFVIGDSAAPPASAAPRPLLLPATLPPRPVAALPTARITPAAPPGAVSAPLATLTPLVDPRPFTAAAQAAALPAGWFEVGRSVEGRAITARRFGAGPRALLLVGGIHGGWEANTVTLIEELIAHFEANPADVLPGMALVLLPAANPDGLARGRSAEGRFNANGVDLNRNWGCNWSAQAVWRDQPVSAGPRPFSEPETQALAALVRQLQPAAVLFYHSAASGVFAGRCNGDHGSALLAQVLGEAAGYSYGQPFSAYRVTGTAPSWVDGQGIPAADVELQSSSDSEFARNLAGVMALQRWLAGGG